jgi:hypothetical protein
MDNLIQTLQAEAGAAEAEKENMNAAEKLGKFKDVKALMEAYTNLEAEFTRRSQRLKELENANKVKGKNPLEEAAKKETAENEDEKVTADKKDADLKGETTLREDAQNPEGKNGTEKENSTVQAETPQQLNEDVQQNVKSENPLLPSHGQEVLDKDKLVEAALQNEDVKNAVIAAYLAGAARNKGVQFISGGVNVPAQRRSPANVKEAGKLAQEFLNKRGN